MKSNQKQHNVAKSVKNHININSLINWKLYTEFVVNAELFIKYLCLHHLVIQDQ